ncbi:hypothetical protein T439DRAFT_74937 [Meredithblackwellia eburnea MCA 4105]
MHRYRSPPPTQSTPLPSQSTSFNSSTAPLTSGGGGTTSTPKPGPLLPTAGAGNWPRDPARDFRDRDLSLRDRDRDRDLSLRERERERERDWRDDYRERDRDRDRDRERRFEVPYRTGPNPRKRSRGSDEEDDPRRKEWDWDRRAQHPVMGQQEWRGGARYGERDRERDWDLREREREREWESRERDWDVRERGYRRVSGGNNSKAPYPTRPNVSSLPSPQYSHDPTSNKGYGNNINTARPRARSYSPGEISEGEPVSSSHHALPYRPHSSHSHSSHTQPGITTSSSTNPLPSRLSLPSRPGPLSYTGPTSTSSPSTATGSQQQSPVSTTASKFSPNVGYIASGGSPGKDREKIEGGGEREEDDVKGNGKENEALRSKESGLGMIGLPTPASPPRVEDGDGTELNVVAVGQENLESLEEGEGVVVNPITPAPKVEGSHTSLSSPPKVELKDVMPSVAPTAHLVEQMEEEGATHKSVDPHLHQKPPPSATAPPSPPISPPRDFSSILSVLVAENYEDKGDVNEIVLENRRWTEKERERSEVVVVGAGEDRVEVGEDEADDEDTEDENDDDDDGDERSTQPTSAASATSDSTITSLSPSKHAGPNSKPMTRDLSNLQLLAPSVLSNHELLCGFLATEFENRDERRGQKMVVLRRDYKNLNEDWQAHCRRLDKLKERIHRRKNPSTAITGGAAAGSLATVPPTPSIDNAGMPFYPEPVTTPGPSLPRTNRRNANPAYGYGDAVRSEAEFLEILASLETADMRDPNVRATRTAAVVPDMIVDLDEKREVLDLSFDDDRARVGDPEDFYEIHKPLDLWTEEEVQIFCKRYSQHPKQFGKIAAELPEKTTAQCVLFYYRMKNTIDFRSLSDRRGRDGRRRKTRRRNEGGSGSGKKTSLLSNLKRTSRAEEDDEDSPPPSPRGGRNGTTTHSLNGKSLDSPTVFPPPDASSRPSILAAAPTPDELSLDEGPGEGGIKGKKLRTPKFRDSRPLEGSLADGDDADEDTPDGSKGGKKSRKVRLDAGENLNAESSAGDGKNPANGQGGAATRRKSASSSYWSVAERNEFVKLLGQVGKNWERIAEGLENKTAVQCRNWFQNHAKKLNLADIAKSADSNAEDDEGDETGSGVATPAEFSVPTGVPLSESLAGAAANAPRPGFFVGDNGHSRLPHLSMTVFDEKSSKAGMQIRNLLNDDTPDEEVPPTLHEGDWFGGGDAGSTGTTEDESDAPKTKNVVKSPPRRLSEQPTHTRPMWDARDRDHPGDRRYAYDAPYHRPPPSQPHYASSYGHPPPIDRYDLDNRPPMWHPSGPTPYPPYGPPADYYRGPPLDVHDRASYPPPRTEYFPAQKPLTFERSSFPPPRPSYPPAAAYPGDHPPNQWSR